MTFEFLRYMYLQHLLSTGQEGEAAEEATNKAVDAAVAKMRAEHQDFDRFLPGLDYLSRFVFCNHAHIPLVDYLETLYAAVKHGKFTRAWRGHLRDPKALEMAVQ